MTHGAEVFLAAMLAAIAGCGDGTNGGGAAAVNAAGATAAGDPGGSSAPVLHCTRSGSGVCTEWFPISAVAPECAGLGGTLGNSACSTVNRIGQCTIHGSVTTGDVVTVDSYYSGRASALRVTCETSNVRAPGLDLNVGITSATWSDG